MSKKRCFVLMPFTDKYNLNEFFHNKLKPFLEKSGYRCDRADTKEGQNLDMRIIEGIYNADIIIADLTRHNCNVFYELGVSHAIPKKTLMVAQSLENLPLDINKYDVLKYDPINFTEQKFSTEITKILGADKCSNPVQDYGPPVEESLLRNFAIKHIKDDYIDSPLKVIFIDLDGTLFNSYEHRTRASKKALQIIFTDKKDEELQKIYESIYLAHDTYQDIVGKNFRYDWRTIDIYKIAYLMEKNINPKNNYEYLMHCANDINAKALMTIEKAYEVFMDEPFRSSPYATQFLEILTELGFKLILVTEGEREVQVWKLKELGIHKYFLSIHVGTPYENLLNLKSYIDYIRGKGNFKNKDINNYEIIYEGYKKMHEEYKRNFHTTTLKNVLEKFKDFQLAVIGDRYDVDLQPYEKINGKNILRIAITQGSPYITKTQEDIRGLKSKNVIPPYICSNLSQAFELLADPCTWERLQPITNVLPISKIGMNTSEVDRIRKARDKISEEDPIDLFIRYADEILKFFKCR